MHKIILKGGDGEPGTFNSLLVVDEDWQSTEMRTSSSLYCWTLVGTIRIIYTLALNSHSLFAFSASHIPVWVEHISESHPVPF